MERTCLACHKTLTGQQRKWCSNSCSCRAYANQKAAKPLDSRCWVPQKKCAYCGEDVVDRPNAKYCSNLCRLQAGHRNQTKRNREKKSLVGLPITGDKITCKHPECNTIFVKKGARIFCSKSCATNYNIRKNTRKAFTESCPVFFYPCPDCHEPVTMSSSNGSHKVCQSCRVKRNKAINARKSHKRRALGPAVLSVYELAARDGTRCHICSRKVDMKLSGQAKWGPTIEHILPVSKGGTNDADNLALAHRHCNTARGNRGHSQLTLVA
jgi:hypothetical protein